MGKLLLLLANIKAIMKKTERVDIYWSCQLVLDPDARFRIPGNTAGLVRTSWCYALSPPTACTMYCEFWLAMHMDPCQLVHYEIIRHIYSYYFSLPFYIKEDNTLRHKLGYGTRSSNSCAIRLIKLSTIVGWRPLASFQSSTGFNLRGVLSMVTMVTKSVPGTPQSTGFDMFVQGTFRVHF